MKIDYDDFINFCFSLVGKTLRTKGERSNFEIVSVKKEGITFKISTGKYRISDSATINKIFDRYKEKGSLKTSYYTDITFNASYILVLLEKFKNEKGL